jgi:CheY-like chemotaxis protein
MTRHLQPDTNPIRVTGRWTPGGYGLGLGPVRESAGELKRYSPATAEPAASPGTLLAGDAAELMPLSEQVEAPQEHSARSSSGERRAVAGHPPTLVIADDDPVVQLLLSMSLGGEFEVVGVAADGDEAIELARTSQPDAALLDVVMPKGGGLGAVRGIVEVAPGTAIVMLSGCQADGVVRELIQAGAVAYRRKSATTRILAEALNDSIKAHTAERRESALAILPWYCLGLDRHARRRTRRT